MEYIGEDKITSKYIGDTLVIKQYQGDTLVYDGSETPVAPVSNTWVDITTIDNTVPFDAIAWATDYAGDEDLWVAVKPGLDTTGLDWMEGAQVNNGWWGQHRWNGEWDGGVYSCTFLGSAAPGDDGPIDFDTTEYGESVKDGYLNLLPQETITVSGSSVNTYMLDFRDWVNWSPCYGAYADESSYGSGVYVRLYITE